jgi:signal recognition particle GTPase
MEKRMKRIAKGTGYSYNTLNKLEELAQAVKQWPEQFGNVIKKIDSGSWKINKPYSRLRGFKLRQQLVSEAMNRKPF